VEYGNVTLCGSGSNPSVCTKLSPVTFAANINPCTGLTIKDWAGNNVPMNVCRYGWVNNVTGLITPAIPLLMADGSKGVFEAISTSDGCSYLSPSSCGNGYWANWMAPLGSGALDPPSASVTIKTEQNQVIVLQIDANGNGRFYTPSSTSQWLAPIQGDFSMIVQVSGLTENVVFPSVGSVVPKLLSASLSGTRLLLTVVSLKDVGPAVLTSNQPGVVPGTTFELTNEEKTYEVELLSDVGTFDLQLFLCYQDVCDGRTITYSSVLTAAPKYFSEVMATRVGGWSVASWLDFTTYSMVSSQARFLAAQLAPIGAIVGLGAFAGWCLVGMASGAFIAVGTSLTTKAVRSTIYFVAFDWVLFLVWTLSPFSLVWRVLYYV